MTIEQVNKAKSYKPTQAMINNAKRALALREKYKRGMLSASEAKDEGVGSGVARARDIINGNLSLQTVKRMYSFFSRHEKNYDPKKKMPDGGPTAGTISYLGWGGSAGYAWARKILREEEILKSYRAEITEDHLNTEDKILGEKEQITKALNEELMQATFVVLVPDEVDLHGDIYDSTEVLKACHSFNQHCRKANLLHLMNTSAFSIAESYIVPTDMILEEKFVKKGSWLTVLQFHDEELWEGVKIGRFNGVSIGALASVESIEGDS